MKSKIYKTKKRSLLKYLAIQFTVIVMACGCEKFVNVDAPTSQLTGETVFQSALTADAVLANIYSTLQTRAMITGEVNGIPVLMGVYADELVNYVNDGSETFFQNNLLPNDNNVAMLWNDGFNLIYDANAIIEGVANSTTISDEDKDRITGEALFIRAYLHFYLQQLFGDIPYVKTSNYITNTNIAKQPASEIYSEMILDLEQAQTLLPESYTDQSRSRPNRYAVLALLARVNLYAGNWVATEEAATLVLLNTETYNIANNLDDVFLKAGPSTIWQLLPVTEGFPTYEATSFIFQSGPPPNRSLTQNLINAFEPGDLRLTHWTGEVTDGSSVWYYAFKYKQFDYLGESQEYSIQLRLEEQYLIRAEARAKMGNLEFAKEDLNVIRNRAGLPNTSATSQNEVLQAILQERRVEFFTENGHRFFDLKRFGQADSVLSTVKEGWNATDVVLPLPQRELNLNPNINPQNAGY